MTTLRWQSSHFGKVLNIKNNKVNYSTCGSFASTEVRETFLKIMKEEEDVSAGVAAIRTLLTVIKNYKGIFL